MSSSMNPASSGSSNKSTLSTESPPFNPHSHRSGLLGSPTAGAGGGGARGNSRSRSRSRSNSPFPPQHYQQQQMMQQQQQQMHAQQQQQQQMHAQQQQQQQQQHYAAQQQQAQQPPPMQPTNGGDNNGSNNAANAEAVMMNANSNAIPSYTFEYEGETLEIRNVWAENVEEEMAVIREVIEKYPYVAMDTEFPGVVAKPVTESYTSDYHYKLLKVNVDLLKIIQLGLSFADSRGNFVKGCPCWQFNFKFDLTDDMFAQDSIDLLTKSGISFVDHQKHGIDPLVFGELLMVSGLVLDDRVKWVSFHSGYDYGYLVKLLTTIDLPNDEKSFFELLKLYFPTIYDVKYMTSLLDGHQFLGGLQKIADDLGCTRIGAEHQAGSDSLLTMATYFALARAKFSTTKKQQKQIAVTSSEEKDEKKTDKQKTKETIYVFDDAKYANELFGYGTNHTVRKGGPAASTNTNNPSSMMPGMVIGVPSSNTAGGGGVPSAITTTNTNDNNEIEG